MKCYCYLQIVICYPDLILKIDSATVNTIAKRRKGMGKTGETWLVGRQNDRITSRNDQVIGKGKIGEPKSGDLIEKALSGESGTTIRTGSTGHMEIISYDPLNITGLNWAIITLTGNSTTSI